MGASIQARPPSLRKYIHHPPDKQARTWSGSHWHCPWSTWRSCSASTGEQRRKRPARRLSAPVRSFPHSIAYDRKCVRIWPVEFTRSPGGSSIRPSRRPSTSQPRSDSLGTGRSTSSLSAFGPRACRSMWAFPVSFSAWARTTGGSWICLLHFMIPTGNGLGHMEIPLQLHPRQHPEPARPHHAQPDMKPAAAQRRCRLHPTLSEQPDRSVVTRMTRKDFRQPAPVRADSTRPPYTLSPITHSRTRFRTTKARHPTAAQMLGPQTRHA